MPDINGIPYVESGDLVAGYPAVSQSLAQEVSDQLATKLDVSGGKILQIVRATDSTDRSTTSTSFVDANISVAITPSFATSAVLLVWSVVVGNNSDNRETFLTITDSSNTSISGAESSSTRIASGGFPNIPEVLIAYATPATTAATTFKGRFRVDAGTGSLFNSTNSTAQLFAIEVSA